MPKSEVKIKLVEISGSQCGEYEDEALANFCQTTRRYKPEDSHLHTRRRENLKSYYV
jgi:hypothetical protein